MPTPTELLMYAKTHLGEKYVLGAQVPMENANWKGPWDCAEFVTYCVNRITGKLYGYRGMEGGGAYTGYWYEDARNGIVKSVSLADALTIEGAILLRKPKVVNERKLIGHIAFTDGKGKPSKHEERSMV